MIPEHANMLNQQVTPRRVGSALNDAIESVTDDLFTMFDRKYHELRVNGATDEQAITLLRGLWLEAIELNRNDRDHSRTTRKASK